MRVDDETSILSALRREPEQTSFLFKVSAATAIALVAWDIAAGKLLPSVAVTGGLVLILLCYGAAMTYFMGRIMTSSRHWASGSATAANRLADTATARRDRPAARGLDIAALRRRPDELPAPLPAPEPVPPEPIELQQQPAPPAGDGGAFNQSYFLLRLQEQVKDARRQGHEMCVAAVHVTVPGVEMTPELAQDVGYEMARLASGQARIMSQPLALNDSEYVFSLPHTGQDETKQFVREIVRALGDYWCYFGIATFPHSGHDAQSLVEQARAACEASLQGGKRGQVEYSSAA